MSSGIRPCRRWCCWWPSAACWPFLISPLFLTSPATSWAPTSPASDPDGLLRRGRVSRRHHHCFAHASFAGAGLFVVRASVGFYAAIIAFTFSRNFYLSGLLLAVAGYCMIISVATINSLLQHLAEDHMRGRVMSIYSTAFLGLPPIGCLVAGSLSHFQRLTSSPECARWRSWEVWGCIG